MELIQLIEHPERMNKETLYDLRSLLALHPYYQTARLLLLQNLYLLHDSSFDEELRKAAIYITDRRVIFQMVEAAHYRLTTKNTKAKADKSQKTEGRTISLIDNFLESIPAEEEEEKNKKRKPTPADAAVDYVSYLVEIESDAEKEKKEKTPEMKGQSLIDNFINNEGRKIQLKEEPEFLPQIDDEEDDLQADEGYFTETLARIYIKQGRYSKALEIIQRLNLNYPKKNAYFADQIRFLEKLIRNSNAKQQ